MKTVSIISRKGGVGKTATVHALGAGLAMRGYKVLYIDLDSQINLTFAVGAQNNDKNSYTMLTGETTVEDSIQETDQGFIIPAHEKLAIADRVVATDTTRIKDVLAPLKKKFDYVIIDTPAALGALTISAIRASDSIIVPVQADIFSLQGLKQVKEAFDLVKNDYKKTPPIKGILITRYNGRAVLSQDMQKSLTKAAKLLNTSLFENPIRECVSIKEAQALQTDIYHYAPRSNAAKDYNAFVDEFLK